jgi:hypothetical protein
MHTPEMAQRRQTVLIVLVYELGNASLAQCTAHRKELQNLYYAEKLCHAVC